LASSSSIDGSRAAARGSHPAVAHPGTDPLDHLAVCAIETVGHAQDPGKPPDQAALAAVEAREVGVRLLGKRAAGDTARHWRSARFRGREAAQIAVHDQW